MTQALVQGNTTALLYDPSLEREHRQRFLRHEIAGLDLANRLSLTTGRWPACAWVLVRAKDYQQFSLYSTDFSLQIADLNRQLIFYGLSVITARCVSMGQASDQNAIYLVQLTDKRGLLANRWFCRGTASQYNTVSPAYPGQYYDSSTNSGIPWSWDLLVGDLWNQASTWLGTYPGLPGSPPSGTPEGYAFAGRSLWDALCDVLAHLGMGVSVDLTRASNQYSIVNLGDSDPALAVFQSSYATLLHDDLAYIDVGSGRVPKQVVVYFHRRNEYYGTEETVRGDGAQWQSTPLYSVTKTAPGDFASASGTHYIWSDFTVRYDVDNVPVPGDVIEASTIADREVNAYFARIYSLTSGYMRQSYHGALPLGTGAQVDGVRWRQDRTFRHGWITEIARGYEPVWPEVKEYGRGY